MSRTAAGQPLVALKIRAAASVRLRGAGTTSVGQQRPDERLDLGRRERERRARRGPRPRPGRAAARPRTAGRRGRHRARWRPSGANRTSDSMNRHGPVAPASSWQSSRTSSSVVVERLVERVGDERRGGLARGGPPPPRPSGRRRSRSAWRGPRGAPGPRAGARDDARRRRRRGGGRIASTVYQAALPVRATRDASVLLPNPAPAR